MLKQAFSSNAACILHNNMLEISQNSKDRVPASYCVQRKRWGRSSLRFLASVDNFWSLTTVWRLSVLDRRRCNQTMMTIVGNLNSWMRLN